jgi:DnaK suppressor protein
MADLTEAELRQFEARLLARREKLRTELHQALLDTRREEYADVAGQVYDSGDASIAEMLIGIDLYGRERELDEMRVVEAALERLREDQFGYCVDCRSPIEKGRLDSYPETPRCITCQTRREAIQRGGKDATPSL